MATITTTTLGQLLKNLYAPWEIEHLVNHTYPVLNSCAAKGSAQLGGAGFFFPVRVEGAEGHAYISESQDLPGGRNTTVRQAQVSPTVHAGVVQLTGLSVAVTQGNAMAFARSFDENVSQTIEAMSAYKEGVLFRDGTGQLATFAEDPDAIETELTMSDVGFLREGMYCDVIDSALDGTQHNSAVKITGVDWVNKTATFDTALAAAGAIGDFLYITGSQVSGTAETSKEPIGLEGALLASGTYLGIARATYPNWNANLMTASSFFDEDVLLRARTRLTQESGIQLSGMAGRMKVVTHPMQADVLFKLAIPRIGYTGGGSFDLGNKSEVSFGGIGFETSYQAPTDKAYLGDFKYFQSLYTPNGELHIDTEYNGSALKWVATKDVGLVFAKEYCAFACKRPNAFVRISSLTEATR
jgi:hypothetical protein